MPELKRNFSAAKMNKDMDERLVPPGQYRDALNIQIATSDGSDVGSAQNIGGTDIRQNMAAVYDNQDPGKPASSYDNAIYGLPVFVPDTGVTTPTMPYLAGSGAIYPGYMAMDVVTTSSRTYARWVGTSTCVGSVGVPDKDKIYYLVSAGDVNRYPGFTTGGQTSASAKTAILGYGMPLKDYIMEYDTVTETLKYVFVDIYHVRRVNTTSAQGSVFIAEEPIAGLPAYTPPAYQTVNVHGIRIGMNVSGFLGNTSFTSTINDDIKVVDIIHIPTLGWEIKLNKPVTVTAGETVEFTAPRVLNFNQDIMITGINVIDDMLFWTDNNSEPKKINIRRSKAGTGGVEYLFTGQPTTNIGHSNFGVNNILDGDPNSIFDGDTDYFHTRLVSEVDGVLQIETNYNNTHVVWAKEDHITTIRKAPTQPLELKMSRSESPRYPILPSGSLSTIPNPSTATVTGNPFIDGNGNLLAVGSLIAITFDNSIDYRDGDIIIFTDSLGTQSALNFTDFQIRCQVVSGGAPNANNLVTNITQVRILTITSDASQDATQDWFARLEAKEPLFEFKFVRFSYRYKYVDGEYSTFAPWSEVAFLPDVYSYVPQKGFNEGMRNQLRNLKLTKYFTDPVSGAIPEDVVEIDLLYKETNNPTVYTIKTVKHKDEHPLWPDVDTYPLARGECEITTDLVHAVVPSNQLLRPWDNIPRKALAQEISANRLIYANYLQSYNVDDPIIELSIHKDTLENLGAEYGVPSVKSLRTYQIGVVYSDDYGRETPVLTNKDASITVPKRDSITRNQISAKLGLDTPLPAWAKYFSWYIKETSSEYHTLAMDRWYFAADGNVWISFPSSERNKLDEETHIILKKGHGDNTPVLEKAKYKILAIENEAPSFIKTEKKVLGTMGCTGTNPIPLGRALVDPVGFPVPGSNSFLVHGNAFDGVFGDTATDPPESLWMHFRTANNTSKFYEITNIVSNLVGQNAGRHRVILKDPMGVDVEFCQQDVTLPPAPNNVRNGLQLVLTSREEEERPEFDGRFFVKIYQDPVLYRYVLVQAEDAINWIPGMSERVYYLNNNYAANNTGFTNHGWNTYMRGDTGGNYTVPTGSAAPSVHPYNKGASPATNGYDHHAAYTWGDNSGGVVFGISANDLDASGFAQAQSHMMCFRANSGQNFWTGVAGVEGFFIDACAAYALTGSRDSGANEQPDNWFFGGVPPNDATSRSFDADAWSQNAGAPGGVPVNVHNGKGQTSRGIWNNGEHMDISWSGMGDGYQGSGFAPFGGYPHELRNVGGTRFDDAASFIERLSTPGTRFRFFNDPDQTIYTVETWPFYDASHPHGTVYRSPAGNPTTQQTGVYGIRNYRTTGGLGGIVVPNLADRRQYRGENLRQRWTIKVSPAIGSTGSGYRPDKGTLNTAPSQVAGLPHDMSRFDTIQIMENASQLDSYIDTFTTNPGIWETEPKETVDLDIYYQASGLIPLKLTEETNEEYLPIDTTFLTRTSPNTLHTITEWDETTDGQTIKFTPAIPANDPDGTPNPQYLEDQDDIFFKKRGRYGIAGRVDTTTGITTQTNPATGNNAFGPGDDTITLHGFRQTGWHYLKLFRRYHILDWSNCWTFGNGVESDRIRDDFNAPQMDNGVKASSVLAEPVKEERREHGLIWSGIYNSVTGVNDTNQFIQAEKITKDLNPIYGSIQKIYSRDTNLLTICEDKVLNIQANKDALFNADGNMQLTATNRVLGTATAYQGDYGISTNPESFAATPGALYFADQMRGKVLSMFGDNHVRPISDIGMKDFFADSLKSHTWKILGTYDDRKSEYNMTTMIKHARHDHVTDRGTISFSNLIKGWTSFKSFTPENGISLNNDYYTWFGGELFKHHQEDVDRNRFYDVPYESTVTLTFNDQPESVKSFNTVNYEGTQAGVTSFTETQATDSALVPNTFTVNDNEYFNLSDKNGWYVSDITTNKQTGDVIEFKEKEGKWFGTVAGDTTDGIIFGSDTYNLDQSEFSVQGLGNATFKYKIPPSSGGGTGPGPGPGAQVANVHVRNRPMQDDPSIGPGWDLQPDDTYASPSQPYSIWAVNQQTITGQNMGAPNYIPFYVGSTFENNSGIFPTPGQWFTVGGGDPNGDSFVDLTITPQIGSQMGPFGTNMPIYSGAQLAAENFSIGGGTLNVTHHPMGFPSSLNQTPIQASYHIYEWTGGNMDPRIKKVILTNNGMVGSLYNSVKARVVIDAFTINNLDEYLLLDIDHEPVNTHFNLRSTNLQITYPYYNNQTAPSVTSISNITGTYTQTGSNSQFYVYSNTGTVPDNKTTMVSETIFTANDGFNYKSTPTVTMQNTVTGAYDYSKSYSTQIIPTYDNGKVVSFKAQIFYTPPQDPFLVVDPINFNNLGHTASINYELQRTVNESSNAITHISYEDEIDRFSKEISITVYGTIGAEYDIQVTKQTSTTSIVPAADGYYDFVDTTFTTRNVNSKQRGVIEANGSSIHFIKIPYVSSKTRYDIVLTSVNGYTLQSKVPTAYGDASIIQYGLNKLTLTPVTYDNTSLLTIPDGVEITRPARMPNREPSITNTRPVFAEAGNGNSSSTTLRLKNPNKNIHAGMHVFGMGTGTHGITVSEIYRDNIIVLSSAAAVPDNTSLRFETPNGSLTTFDFTIKPALGSIGLSIDYIYKDPDSGNVVQGRQPIVSDVVGFDDVAVNTSATSTGSTGVKISSTDLIVPGMVVQGGKGTANKSGIKGLELKTVSVSSVTDADDIVLDLPVTLESGTALEFLNPNNQVEVVDIQAKEANGNIVIQGTLKLTEINEVYIDGTLQSTATAFVNLDNFIKVKKHS